MNSFREGLFQIPALVIAGFFFCLIFFLNYLGYATRKKLTRLFPGRELELRSGEGSLLGLMALLLAFSFGMAAAKFESRRQTIIDEANVISTAILRCDLYPDSIKQNLLKGLKNYLEYRISYFEAGDDPEKIDAAMQNASGELDKLWNSGVQISMTTENPVRNEQLIQTFLSMSKIMVDREAGRIAAVPGLIILVLLLLVFVSSFLTGYGIEPGKRSVLLSVSFALMTTIVLYLVMELSRPREGFVNLKSAEEKLEDLREMFR
jgi:hypothetical protein